MSQRHKDPAVNAHQEWLAAQDEQRAVHGGYIPPSMEGANPVPEQAKREMERLHRLGPGAVPPLGGRELINSPKDEGFEFWTKEDARKAGQPNALTYEDVWGKPPAITNAEVGTRLKEWESHILRVAEPINPNSPFAHERIRREFGERYPDAIEEFGHDAFAPAFSAAAKELGENFLSDRFRLYELTDRKMREQADAAEDDGGSEAGSPQARQMLSEFRAKFPDLAGDLGAIEKSANYVLDTLSAHKTAFDWERREDFLSAVAIDMRSRGTGKPIPAGRRGRKAGAESEDDIDNSRTQLIARIGRLDSAHSEPARGDMLSDLAAVQRKLGIL